jgi:hypothetical protein
VDTQNDKHPKSKRWQLNHRGLKRDNSTSQNKAEKDVDTHKDKERNKSTP